MDIKDNIFWIGHAGFYIKANGTTIFIDPFKVSGSVKEKADILLITHPHFDHNNKEDIDKVRKEDTKFIAPQKCLEDKKYKQAEVSKPGSRTEISGIVIEAVPAYNTAQEKQKFHPKSENWVGYVINVNGTRIYHAGDTDLIPEMGHLKDIDVALLPMGGMYTMDEDAAAQVASIIKPNTVIPMHYKMVLGKEKSDKLEMSIKEKLKNVLLLREVQDPIYSF